jgi:hypothetical protein
MTIKRFTFIVLIGFLVSCSDKSKPDESRFVEYAVNYFNEGVKKGEPANVKNIRLDTVLLMSSRKMDLLRARYFEMEVGCRTSINHYLRLAQLDSVDQRLKQAEKLPNDDVVGYRVKFLLDFVKQNGKVEPGFWYKSFDTQYKPLDEFDWVVTQTQYSLVYKKGVLSNYWEQ